MSEPHVMNRTAKGHDTLKNTSEAAVLEEKPWLREPEEQGVCGRCPSSSCPRGLPTEENGAHRETQLCPLKFCHNTCSLSNKTLAHDYQLSRDGIS